MDGRTASRGRARQLPWTLATCKGHAPPLNRRSDFFHRSGRFRTEVADIHCAAGNVDMLDSAVRHDEPMFTVENRHDTQFFHLRLYLCRMRRTDRCGSVSSAMGSQARHTMNRCPCAIVDMNRSRPDRTLGTLTCRFLILVTFLKALFASVCEAIYAEAVEWRPQKLKPPFECPSAQ